MNSREAGGDRARGGERIVGFELHHRPHHDAERRQRFFEQGKLRLEVGFDAFAGLVAGPELVSERLDDVIGRHRQVRGASVDHPEDRADHAAHRANLQAVGVACRRHRVVVTEQLVGSVDEKNLQARLRPQYIGLGCSDGQDAVSHRSAGRADAGQARDRSAGRRLSLRAEVGRVSRHRVPRRRGRVHSEPRPAAARSVLSRAARHLPGRPAGRLRRSTARS